MTFNQLRIFDIVAKYSNITLAAREMRVSQPSVSKQLKALQDDYGVKFYNRGIKGIELTEEGRQFLKAIRPILLQIADLENAIRTRGSTANISTLKIAAGESPSVSLMPGLLKSFKQNHPRVQLFLRTNESASIEQLIINKEVELGITTNASADPQIISEQFVAAKVAAIVVARSILSTQKAIDIEDLCKIPVITKVGRRICKQIEQELGIKLNIVLECESVEAVKAAVKAGIGMGFQYRDAIESELQSGQLIEVPIPFLKKLRVNWFILRRKHEQLSKNAIDFLALLHNVSNFSKTSLSAREEMASKPRF